MRIEIALASALLGMAPLARGQRLGFTHQMLPAHIDPARAVAFLDVEGDGDLDALVGNGDPASSLPLTNRLYLNGGTGVFTTTNLPVPPATTRAVALGDVDADGDLDALVGTSFPCGPGGCASGSNRLYLNGGTGVFTDATGTNLPALSGSTLGVALGDVDGDGDLDAFAGQIGQKRLYLNGGTGVFTDATATSVPALVTGTTTVALGDVDVDGDLDAVMGVTGSPQGGQNRLYLNDGTGILADVTATNVPVALEETYAVALGDVDGDGDLDALLGTEGQDQLHLNGGTGVFTDATATNLPAVYNETYAVALGDVDGDGDLDALLGNGGFLEQNRLYLNGGTGAFADVTATNLPAIAFGDTVAVALGDVDGDGDLDAFLGNSGQNRLYLNGGTGVFADATATSLPAQADSTVAVALGDVDGDGDLDAFVGNYGQQSRLYLNGGTGVFTDFTATNLPSLVGFMRAASLGDVDGDGDLDAFLGIPMQNRLLDNGGTGVFTDVTATSVPVLIDTTLAAALGDLDGDGDLDAFVGNYARQSRIQTNLTRQLAWRGIPRAGKPLTLDVRGPANGAWLLAASPANASISLPPLGTLRLFPP
ncbi:MAG: VCBS repeat-containing protein, partial [Planctomycetes bacterium]|nr:VCBS repeat-containing protein [Planctomycetota bacterium]